MLFLVVKVISVYYLNSEQEHIMQWKFPFSWNLFYRFEITYLDYSF